MRNVKFPPHPSVTLSEVIDGAQRMTREWYDWVLEFTKAAQFNSPLTGSVTFAAATTAAVTFTTAEPNTNYNVIIEAPEQRTVWITGKTTTGFTINLSSSSSATYLWTVIRR